MKLKLLILDWNGTMCDDRSVAYASVLEIFEHYGIPAPPAQTYFAEITADYISFYRRHGLPEEAKPEDLNRIREEFLTKHVLEAELHEGVVELLEFSREKDIRTAIVSAEIHSLLIGQCRMLGLDRLLDHIEGNAWEKEKKLREALTLFNADPKETGYVDDTKDGLEVGRKIGLRTIGFLAGYAPVKQILEAEPEFCVSSFPEIQRIVNHWQAMT